MEGLKKKTQRNSARCIEPHENRSDSITLSYPAILSERKS